MDAIRTLVLLCQTAMLFEGQGSYGCTKRIDNANHLYNEIVTYELITSAYTLLESMLLIE